MNNFSEKVSEFYLVRGPICSGVILSNPNTAEVILPLTRASPPRLRTGTH